MAYKLVKQNGVYLENVNEYVCDAEADLASIPTTGWNGAVFGAKAFCIAEGTTHYLDSTGNWVNPLAVDSNAPADTTPDTDDT